GHRSEPLQWALYQLVTGVTGAVEQDELHQQLAAHIPHVADGPFEPLAERSAAARSRANDRALRATGTRGLTAVLDQSLARERGERSVDDRARHGPHAPERAIRVELPGDGPAVRGLLRDHAEHGPIS